MIAVQASRLLGLSGIPQVRCSVVWRTGIEPVTSCLSIKPGVLSPTPKNSQYRFSPAILSSCQCLTFRPGFGRLAAPPRPEDPLEELPQVLRSHVRLPQDGAQCTDGEISIAVNRDDDERSLTAPSQIVMASTNMDDLESGALESTNDAPAADSGKFAQEVAT